MAVGGFLTDFGIWDPEADANKGASSAPAMSKGQSVAATREADPCAGYITWAEQHNQKLLAGMNVLQQTPAAGVQVAHTEEIRTINELITWYKQSDEPSAATDFERLAIEQWTLMVEVFTAMDEDDYGKATDLLDKKISIDKQTDEAHDRLVDACYY